MYKTDVMRRFKKLKSPKQNLYELQLDYDVKKLESIAKNVINKHGIYSFNSKEGRIKSSYKSLSLVYDPYNKESVDNQYTSTLGSSLISRKRYFYTALYTLFFEFKGKLKHSYYDTYSFNTPNSIMTDDFSDFLKTFKRTQIRSRLSVILANAKDSLQPDYLLHRDEHVYQNLRINITLTFSDKFFLDLIGEKTICFEQGKAYTWNTNMQHRVYGVDSVPRINLVLGFSPWFDYIPEEDIWVSNEYYGEIHPIEMVKQGLVIDCIHNKLAL
jgi:hypothetical protein